MAKKLNLKAALEEILATKRFERLDPYRQESSWTRLNGDERQLLANLFVLQGEQHLKQGDSQAIDIFRLANRISGQDPRILYRQGLAFSGQRKNGTSLRLAAAAFKEATDRESGISEVWEAWGTALVRQGLFYGEMAYFHEADEKFMRAEALLEQQQGSESDALLYWHWGECWYELGMQSGEAMDFRYAVEKLQEAERRGAHGASFWKDCACALSQLGQLIGRHELILDAVDAYQKAVVADECDFDSWLYYACCLKTLYEWTGKEEYFLQAIDGFERAGVLSDDSVELWWRWGELLGLVGWAREDVHLLKQSAEKLACADLCENDHPDILMLWGSVLMHSGALTERFSLLKQAEEKILRSIELDPENPESWCAYGSCLCELGCYFGDDEYYLQAMSRYQYALTLDPENARLWQGLGQAQFAAGELQVDLNLMERSLEAYERAAACDSSRSPELWADWGVALMKLGDLLQKGDMIESAIHRFEQAINLHCEGDRREIHWLYHYGCALDILGDFREGTSHYERAIQVLNHVLSLDPDHRAARHNLALAYFHLAEVVSDVELFHKAIAELQAVVLGDEEDEVAWNDLGLTLLSLAQLVDDPSQQALSDELRVQAESGLTQAAALGSIQAYYNLSCLYSLAGRCDEALDKLHRARHHQALPPIEDLLQDDWLDNVRQEPGFREFIQELN